AETTLRVIQRARAAEAPKFCRQEKPLHLVAVRPPTVPEISNVAARFLAIRGKIGCGEESGDAEEDCLEVFLVFSERGERQSLSEQSKRELVLFVAERSRELLEKRGIAPVTFDDAFQARGLSLEPELRRRDKNAFEPVL